MAALGRFELLTFDCYGTLIDWEKGIVAALKALLKKYNKEPSAKEILEAYAEFETKLETGSYIPYKDVLQGIVKSFGDKYQLKLGEEEQKVLVKSLPTWPAFYDTIHSLKRLKGRFKLGVISNIDRDLFALTQAKLEMVFNWVITSEDVGSYKPARKNFEEMLKVSGVPIEKALHVGQSLYHDIKPAKQIGLKTVWINRRRGMSGGGATPKTKLSAEEKPDLELPDMDTFVDYIFHLTNV